VPEHMRVSFERQLGFDPRSLDQLGKTRHGERCIIRCNPPRFIFGEKLGGG
jgi:hypothetical protein